MSTETNEIEPSVDARPKTKQEENWLFMSVLQVPWHHANKIEDPADRAFLVNKALEVQQYLAAEQARQQEALMRSMESPSSGLVTPPSPQIVAP